MVREKKVAELDGPHPVLVLSFCGGRILGGMTEVATGDVQATRGARTIAGNLLAGEVRYRRGFLCFLLLASPSHHPTPNILPRQ